MKTTPATDPRVAFFNRLANSWDDSGPPVHKQLERLEELRAGLGLRPGTRVLEIGCGTGLVTGWLARQVAPGQVTAIDFSPAMLARARERHPDVTHLAWDICDAPTPSSNHDVAFCLHVIPHFRDLDTAFRNIADSLQPDGTVVILHLSGRDHVNDVHRRIGGAVEHDLLPDANELRERLRRTGFVIEEAIDTSDIFLVRARKSTLVQDAR